jgi:hypothetical protein
MKLIENDLFTNLKHYTMAFKIANLKNPTQVITFYPDNLTGEQLKLADATLDSDDQKWEMLPLATDGTYYGVVIYSPSRNLAISFYENNKGLTVQPFNPNTQSNQVQTVPSGILWAMMPNQNYLRFAQQSDEDKRTVEAAGDDPQSGALVESWNFNHGDNQRWQIFPA